MKKWNSQKYKKESWKLFSKIIRYSYADYQGYATCVTCGEEKPWKELQAGHFVDGRNNTVLFDRKLVHPQCYRCNCVLSGNKIRYVLFMKKRYKLSDNDIKKLDDKKHEIKQISLNEWKEIYQSFKNEVNEKGIL